MNANPWEEYKSRKIVIAGGTGNIGSSLVTYFALKRDNVTVLTRKPTEGKNAFIRYVYWDGKTEDSWTSELEGADVIFNFCGKSVDCRYTASNKRKLIESRVAPTKILGQAIKKCKQPPTLWVNSSSAAYYGFSDKVLDESSPAGEDFPAEICKKWEDAFFVNETPGTRKVVLRLGIVLQKNKGLILPFVRLAKSFFGGPQGTGKQYFTWIHEYDFYEGLEWIIKNDNIQGAYNLSSAGPVDNQTFMENIRKAMEIPFGFPMPEWVITLGGAIIGTEPYLVLKGRRVVPEKFLQSGFKFKYPEIREALNHLLKN